MKRLPKHEDSEEKQAYYDYLNRWNKNHKIHYIIILTAVFLFLGVLLCWLKSSGLLDKLIDLIYVIIMNEEPMR